MFTITVWTDDHKLLQEWNLTVRQPRRAPITLYISFIKRHPLMNEGLVNHVGDAGSECGSNAPHASTLRAKEFKQIATLTTRVFYK